MAATGPFLAPGTTVPGTKYQIVKSLGAGGMGIVYQVVKPPNIGGVLKLMSAELTAHEEHRTRFFDEVRILARLDHPNIVRVFDYDALPNGTPFYVMELLSGRTVRDVLETMGRVPPRIAYEITRQLLDALQCAHTHEVQVIHRDIKPENIFLHAPRHGEPVVKLIDFGVSAVSDRAHDGAFVGTWSYAAPEQIRGEAPTAETDLYAVALVLYEMLAGRGPFDHHEDWTDVSQAQLHEIPAPVSQHAPWVPASIVALVQSALAKEPRMRPRSAWAFAERLYDLEYASDGASTSAKATEVTTGPLEMPRARGKSRVRPDGVVSVAGSGPLARVLTSVAQASPAPPGAPAAPGTGVEEARGPAPRRGTPVDASTSALLAGLGSEPRRTPVNWPPQDAPGRAADGRGDHGLPHGMGSAGAAAAVTLDGPLAAGARSNDTFASQSTEARGLPRPRGRLVMVLAGSALLFVAVVAGAVLAGRPAPVAPATTGPPSAPSSLPAPVSAPPASSLTGASAMPAGAAPSATASSPRAAAGPSSPTSLPASAKPAATAPKAPALAPKPSAGNASDFSRTF